MQLTQILELSVTDFKITGIINVFKKINDKIKSFKWKLQNRKTQ